VASQKRASPARCDDSGEARGADQLGGPVSFRNSVSLERLQVVVSPTPSGRKWRAAVDGKILCVSTSPLIMSARVLIAQGFDPNCMIEMVHAGADSWSLRGQLGAVAATLIDGETAARCAKNGVPVRLSSASARQPSPCDRATRRRGRTKHL
jgi:hypothetical protein